MGTMQGAAVAAIGCTISFIRHAIEDIFGKQKTTGAQAVGSTRK